MSTKGSIKRKLILFFLGFLLICMIANTVFNAMVISDNIRDVLIS